MPHTEYFPKIINSTTMNPLYSTTEETEAGNRDLERLCNSPKANN